MSDSQQRRPVNDDDLLASAVPIDASANEDADQPAPDPPPRPSQAGAETSPRSSKIRTFDDARVPHEDHWDRQPNVTGQGAIHVKTFVSKLRPDAIEHMDEQVNQWLDKHPEYEVKFVTTSIGTLVGKTSEQALFMNVWV